MAQRAGSQAEQRGQAQPVSPIPAKHVIPQVTQQQRTMDYSHRRQQKASQEGCYYVHASC